jgi:hypothetical protein
MILFNELERHREASLHTTTNVLHRFGYNHFANLLFYKIYTMILFNELERHREATLQFYKKFVLHTFHSTISWICFFTKYIQWFFSMILRLSPLNKFCLHGFGYNHFANLLFYKILWNLFSMNLRDIEALSNSTNIVCIRFIQLFREFAFLQNIYIDNFQWTSET